MQDIHSIVIRFHVIFSSVFLFVALWTSLHSLFKWVGSKEFNKFDNNLSKFYIIYLYADLMMGIILFFFLKKPEEMQTVDEAMRYSVIRFWAVLHFSIMVFVTILSQIGRILSVSTTVSSKKFKYAFFYYGTSTIITISSVTWFVLNN